MYMYIQICLSVGTMDEEYGKIWPSEYYAADALACDNCTWIVYKVGETEEDISSWLQKYAPSKTYRSGTL